MREGLSRRDATGNRPPRHSSLHGRCIRLRRATGLVLRDDDGRSAGYRPTHHHALSLLNNVATLDSCPTALHQSEVILRQLRTSELILDTEHSASDDGGIQGHDCPGATLHARLTGADVE